MKIPFRRRKIIEWASDGTGLMWSIPLDTKATDDADALVRHLKWLSRFDEVTLAALMSTRLGSLAFGQVRYIGPKMSIDMLGRFEDVPQATAGPLSDEEYEEMMYEDSPLMREVYRRLRLDA